MTSFIDTNVLIYAAGNAPDEKAKRTMAKAILERPDCALSIQVLHEFIAQSTRPKPRAGLSFELATDLVRAWRRFPIQEMTLSLLDQGLALFRQHRFSFWDSMIVAAALAQGCDILFTEDMQHGRIVEGLRIVDPFR